MLALPGAGAEILKIRKKILFVLTKGARLQALKIVTA
jgi:hypothetical protein